jgi:RNA polymerase sigma factor (sigma-70 family)
MPKFATRAAVRLGDGRLAALAAAGDERAFEAIYDRHHRALLGFCRHMVGSVDEAEDALQQTFLRAHRALVEHGPPEDLRPWLFAIARNRCRTLLAARRAEDEVDDTLAGTEGLGEQVQGRADLRAVVADVARLPDEQRAALVLAELADLSHAQIGEVIGVRAEKVKALIHQARTTLIAERDARERPCEEVREVLATARGGALRRGPLRRHLRQCAPCRAYGDSVAEQRRALALALPVTPSLGLKTGVLGSASAAGGGVAAKVVATALVVTTAAGGGAAIVREVEQPSPAREAVVQQAPAPVRATATPAPVDRRAAVVELRVASRERASGRRTKADAKSATPAERRAERRARSAAPERGRSELAHARAPGQQVRANRGRPVTQTAPGSSRSPRAPAKKAKPVAPLQHVKPAEALEPGPPLIAPGQERRETAVPKAKLR